MYWAIVVPFVVGLVTAKPPMARSREEIEEFRRVMESTKYDEGNMFYLRGMPLPDVNPEENSAKYQGDIVLDDTEIDAMVDQYAMIRNAYILTAAQWPNNTVVWQFKKSDFDASQQQAIQTAINLIMNKTCIKFRQRKPKETIYVSVTGNITGCYSTIGYAAARGVHVLNLAPHTPGVGCLRLGTIVHEWMHVLGFLHMHSTHDRDDYVRIVKNNIAPGMEPHFIIVGTDQVSNLGVEYDYQSCLHYSPTAFSVNGKPTIIPLQKFKGEMGQRDFVTDSDWLRINRHYNCPGAWD